MGLATLGGGIWWELSLLGAALLNVIEGGRKRHVAATPTRLNVSSLLAAIPDGAFLLDHQARILDVNNPAEKLLALSRGELIGSEIAPVLGRNLETGAELYALLQEAARGSSPGTVQTMFRCSNGDALRVTLAANPLRDHSTRVRGVLLTVRDITELTALRNQSDRNERQVAVGQMTAGLVHDFNNVLSTISEAVMALQIEGQGQTSRQNTILGIIRNAVKSGAETIRNTREYLVGGKEKPSLIQVRTLLEEVLELTHPVLKTRTEVTVVRNTTDCPRVLANVDELRRAFTNLVLNALEAMSQGGTLTVACTTTDQRVLVRVADTGAGIPVDVQKRIFSPYFTTKAKGTGLGLAGARRAIEAQGGDIRFESVPGAGTTFYVSLPLASSRAHQAPTAA